MTMVQKNKKGANQTNQSDKNAANETPPKAADTLGHREKGTETETGKAEEGEKLSLDMPNL